MSPCDLPLWYLRLDYGQAEARCAAEIVPPDYWPAYQKAWWRKWGRMPRLTNCRGKWHASKDLARSAYPSPSSV